MKYFDAILETDEIDWGELKKPSEEQAAILNSISQGNSVKVIANAGTGKTTLSLQIAKAFSTKKVLILTFNAQNKAEGIVKVWRHRLLNCEYSGFDAFFSKITNRDTSKGIDPKDMPLFKEQFKQQVDILVIDEAQDLTEKYYQEVLIIIQANPGIQVVAVGDPKQAVSETFGACFHDRRFFLLIGELTKINFDTLPLSVTYRHGQEVCDLVNRGTSYAPSTKITTIIFDKRRPWETYAKISQLTKEWDDNHSVFLAPAPKLFSDDMEHISSANSLFYISDRRKEVTTTEIEYQKNKRCLLSVHIAKGREWDNVLYFKKHHYKSEEKQREILDYVAMTRVRKELIVVSDSMEDSQFQEEEKLTVTNLCKYINTDYANSILKYEEIKCPGKTTQIDFSKEYDVGGKKILENESLFFEAKIKWDAYHLMSLKNFKGCDLPDMDTFMRENTIPKNKIDRKWEDFERKDITNNIVEFFKDERNIWAEQPVEKRVQGKYIVDGRTDFICFDQQEVIELKIKNGEFTMEDKIQLAIYKAMLCREPAMQNMDYLLYNPVTQKCLRLCSDNSVCQDVLEKQVYFRTTAGLNDREFISRYIGRED